MAKYYAYILLDTGVSGVTIDWEECKTITSNHKSRYKKFNDKDLAQQWLDNGANYEEKDIDLMSKEKNEKENIYKDAIYFDAGTGRGNGTEMRITDYKGEGLLHFIINQSKLNEFGNYYLQKGKTNNFGELSGMYAALKYAMKYNIDKICGDSELVIKYWSIGRYNPDNIDEDTIKLIDEVTLMREEFEKKGGKIFKVSGDYNPADLGFHKK